MSTSNTSLLTRSHAVYSAKKRAKKAQIQEVVFDDEARREYLTGFRKRNLLKKEAKRLNAKERERLEKLELRKQHRQELAERAAKNVREVEGAFGTLPENAVMNAVFTSRHDKTEEEEIEFEDEEQLAVVTVVEDFAADSLRHPAPQQSKASSSPVPPQPDDSGPSRSIANRSREKNVFKTKPKLKAKSGKIRYETKAGRKVERTKQRARRTEKAERAGGKKNRGAKR